MEVKNEKLKGKNEKWKVSQSELIDFSLLTLHFLLNGDAGGAVPAEGAWVVHCACG